MSFALTPFATHPFGTTALTGPMTSSGVGSAAGTSTASAVSDLWGSVVFQADFDPVNPANNVNSPVIDYKGHTVLKGSYPRVKQDIGGVYSSTGGGYLQGGSLAGHIAYVDGLLSEFNGFRITDKWTIEFRLLAGVSASGYALSIQATTGGSPLTVFVNPVGTTFGILVKPQNQSTAYATGQIYTAEDYTSQPYTWHSFIVECDGSSVKIIHDTVQATTTTDTSLSYNSAVANSLTLLGLSKDHSGSLLYLDELRITKAARYGGSGYPASPWPYYNGREGWSFVGSVTGNAAAEFVSEELYGVIPWGVGHSHGSATVTATPAKILSRVAATTGTASSFGAGAIFVGADANAQALSSAEGAGVCGLAEVFNGAIQATSSVSGEACAVQCFAGSSNAKSVVLGASARIIERQITAEGTASSFGAGAIFVGADANAQALSSAEGAGVCGLAEVFNGAIQATSSVSGEACAVQCFAGSSNAKSVVLGLRPITVGAHGLSQASSFAQGVCHVWANATFHAFGSCRCDGVSPRAFFEDASVFSRIVPHKVVARKEDMAIYVRRA